MFRAFVWIVLRFIYRIDVQGLNRIPDGPAVLTPNHVSYIDAALVSAHIPRRITFVMYWKIYNRFRWIVAPLGAIPIASKTENEIVYRDAFRLMGEALERGELVCLFPEGMLTRDGEMNQFQRGLKKLLAAHPVPVVPIGLTGLYGTYFSRKYDGVFHLPDRWMSKIKMRVGKPVAPMIEMSDLREKVLRLVALP